MSEFKPMLACKADLSKLSYPLYVQPKLDGIRASVVDRTGEGPRNVARLLTRTLKQVPNREIFDALSHPSLSGLDGELIVGDPTASDCYRRTSSFVMAENKTGEPWCYYVFDLHDQPTMGFADRYAGLIELVSLFSDRLSMQIVPTFTAKDADELETYEQMLVDNGHEGAILRAPHAPYKYGRASKTKAELVKVKRFEDAEAEIVGVYEEQHNANEAKTNALGRTERSTAQAGKVGKGTLGGFYLRDLETGVEFKCGTGFDAAERADLWNEWHAGTLTPGVLVKYKSFKVGVKDKPRHPVFLGFRDVRDM